MQQPHPSRLGITPIVESNLEIRFTSVIPSSAIPGMIYNALKDSYQEMLPTNVLEIPDSIRSHAPELKFAPLYRLVGNDKKVSVGVGQNVLTVFYNKELHNDNYPGWTSYIHDEVIDICKKINAMNIISETDRLGLRTIDFFEKINIFNKSELELNFNHTSILDEVTTLERAIIEDGFNCNVIIKSQTSRKFKNDIQLGSVIDIDTNVKLSNNLFADPDDIIMRCHRANKKTFFDLLKKEFIDTLDPRE
ncbi:TIGR04255 family protein [Sulfurimonas sp. HSL-1716]|uniref:TIGR04255 family protein n=1 Tax=Hydrocurvibacter sulfurireducens TaxID=3131937 RepID=UPI0031FA304D